MNGLLKGELGFQGYVVSDWFGTHSGYQGINAGQDMVRIRCQSRMITTNGIKDMPGSLAGGKPGDSFFGGNITVEIKNGSLVSRAC